MDAIYEVRGLTKRYGRTAALNGVDFAVTPGKLVGLLGPNGSGKTTLLRMLALLSRPTRGDLSILGVDALEEPDRLRSRIGLISHKSMLYGDLTARENLRFFASLYGDDGGRGGRADTASVDARIDELLRLVELDHRCNDCVRTFSRGMQQRLSIARALVNDPAIILADEPTGNLDSTTGRMVLDTFHALRQQGKTIVLITHGADIAAEADRRITIRDGRLYRDARSAPVVCRPSEAFGCPPTVEGCSPVKTREGGAR